MATARLKLHHIRKPHIKLMRMEQPAPPGYYHRMAIQHLPINATRIEAELWLKASNFCIRWNLKRNETEC